MNILQYLFGSSESVKYIDDEGDMLFLSEIGAGAFGSVSLVRQESTGKLYAAKKGLNFGLDLATELQSCLAVKHRNVAAAFPYYYDDGDGLTYILTDFVEGPSLLHFLCDLSSDGQKLSVAEVAWIGREIALGLQSIHGQGMVHRDLSYNNVILSNGKPVIIDFGLAKESLTKATGSICGTPNFMAPEVGFARATPRSDIFSLGAILYMLHFQRPIMDDYGRGIALDLRFRKKLKKHEEPLVRIIEKAISLDPHERHSSARQLAVDLKPLADQISPDWWNRYHNLLYECAETCESCEYPLPGRATCCPYCSEPSLDGGSDTPYPRCLAPFPCDSCEAHNSVTWTYCASCGEELQ